MGTVIAIMTYYDSDKDPHSAQVLPSLALTQAKCLIQAELSQVPTASAG
ncbi:hypothetical protein [Streptomyces griseocarneus]|nr:hypothetical protein [Streptomyces griseocarneus]MBZ6474996.1 hypothetical protein [Streptomyces griseocarneus]